MSALLSNLDFRLMALTLRMREWFRDLNSELQAAGLEKGQVVLDYGCGAGSYTSPAAKIVGEKGTVYALDIQPLALQTVEGRAARQHLANIKTILMDRATGLPDQSVDAVLLYDVLHAIQDEQPLLKELYRVLKPGGTLSVKPEHIAETSFLEIMHRSELFSLESQRGDIYRFIRRA